MTSSFLLLLASVADIVSLCAAALYLCLVVCARHCLASCGKRENGLSAEPEFLHRWPRRAGNGSVKSQFAAPEPRGCLTPSVWGTRTAVRIVQTRGFPSDDYFAGTVALTFLF